MNHPHQIPNLLCFWDFQSTDHNGHYPSVGKYNYPLQIANGPIALADEGVFGEHSLEVRESQWLFIPRHDCPGLNIHGAAAQVSVVAWIKWNSLRRCQAVAGMWDESRRKRQYCLFLNLSGRYDSLQNVHGHVSAVGGPTPGDKYCVTYSTGKSIIPQQQWTQIAMTYDGQFSRIYVNGALDENDSYNPYFYGQPLFDGGSDGSDFTVCSVSASGKMTNFFAGLLGGLTVYDRALEARELQSLSKHEKTLHR